MAVQRGKMGGGERRKCALCGQGIDKQQLWRHVLISCCKIKRRSKSRDASFTCFCGKPLFWSEAIAVNHFWDATEGRLDETHEDHLLRMLGEGVL